MEILDIVTVLSAGMMVGVEFAVSAFVNPTLAKLDPRAEAEATRLFAKLLGFVMPFWYAFCFLGLVVETVLRRQTGGFALLIAASGIWAAVIVLTLVFLVPINNRLARMQPAEYGVELRRQHSKWEWMHRGRVLLLAVAVVCLLQAILV